MALELKRLNTPNFVAEYNDREVVVYQAFNNSIADYILKNNCYGGDFSFSRTSWIKTSFFWMMKRSNWATKKNQERVLRIHIDRNFFEILLDKAVPSAYSADTGSIESWRKSLLASDIIIQYDPDRDVFGNRLKRKAIQIGLRKGALLQYSKEKLISVEDISDFVRKQYSYVRSKKYDLIKSPEERTYERCKP